MQHRLRLLGAIFLAALVAVIVGAGSASAWSGGNNGNGQGPPSGPGNACQPGYHGEPKGSTDCHHNGNGGGNCGQNQGKGNGGNDNGYGHKPGCGGQPPTCPSGTKWSNDSKSCVPCKPPPCKPGTHREGQTCVPNAPPPPPPCPTGMHRENGNCVTNQPPPPPPPAPCPTGTSPVMQGGQQVCIKVVVTPGPTKIVTVPCKCKCAPKHGHKPTPKHHKHKAKCPKVKKSQIKVSFTPKHLKSGNLHLHVRVPKSWHLRKIALAICTPKSGIGWSKSCVRSKKTVVKHLTIKVKNGRGQVVLPLWRTDLWGHWLWGHHRLQFTMKLKCGLKIVVKKPYFNYDPPKGVVVRHGRLVRS